MGNACTFHEMVPPQHAADRKEVTSPSSRAASVGRTISWRRANGASARVVRDGHTLTIVSDMQHTPQRHRKVSQTSASSIPLNPLAFQSSESASASAAPALSSQRTSSASGPDSLHTVRAMNSTAMSSLFIEDDTNDAPDSVPFTALQLPGNWKDRLRGVTAWEETDFQRDNK